MIATMDPLEKGEKRFRIERVHCRYGAHRGSVWRAVVQHDAPFLCRVASCCFALVRVAARVVMNCRGLSLCSVLRCGVSHRSEVRRVSVMLHRGVTIFANPNQKS